MPFLRANVIPVIHQIHANGMHPLCLTLFFSLFVNVPDIVHFLLIKYVDIVNAELIESTLKHTIN